jgi:hypothetical protein
LKFLIGVILAFVALSLAPALLSQGGSGWAIGLGILLLFFVGPGIVSWLVGAALGSRIGGILVFGLILFFMANPRACPGLPRGLGGDAGQIAELASARFQAESDYDECVQDYIDQEARNAALTEDALACQAEADRAVTSCLGRIGEHFWNFDKPGSCRAEASETSWRTCAETAIRRHADDAGEAALLGCSQRSKTTGLMRRIAGIISGQSEPSPPPPPPVNPAAYDYGCLVQKHNDNNQAISNLINTGKLPAGGCPRFPVESQEQFQCLVDSLSALGPAGVDVANSCKR